MSYTRQYTQGVGWENEPSTNTPISAENLNQMDNAILNIDAAVAAAFASSAGAINGYKITGLRNANSALYAGISYDDDINNHGGDIYVITSAYDVPEKSGGWQLHIEFSPSSSVNLGIRDCDGNILTSALPVGDIIICKLNIVGSTRTVSLLAYIPAAGGGGGSANIVTWDTQSTDSTTNSINIGSVDFPPAVGDVIALRVNANLTFSYNYSYGLSWGITCSTSGGLTAMYTNVLRKVNNGTNDYFRPDLKKGDVLLMMCTVAGNNPQLLVISSMDKDALIGGGTGKVFSGLLGGADNRPYDGRASKTLTNYLALSVDPSFELVDGSTVIFRRANSVGFSDQVQEGAQLYLNVNNTGAIQLRDINYDLITFTDYNDMNSYFWSAYTFTATYHKYDDVDPEVAYAYWEISRGSNIKVNVADTAFSELLDTIEVDGNIYYIPDVPRPLEIYRIEDKFSPTDPYTVDSDNIHISMNNWDEWANDGSTIFFQFSPTTTVNWTSNGMVLCVYYDIGSHYDFDAYYNGVKVTDASVLTIDSSTVYMGVVRRDRTLDDYVMDIFKIDNSSGGGGGASTLAALTDTTISSPTAAQPLTYDATTSKWINGGIIPIANGGTGNAVGYIQTGKKANTTIGTGATAEGGDTTASGNHSHAEGWGTKAIANNSHAEGGSTEASGGASHAEGNGSKATGAASHAENSTNTASGPNSHAGGNLCTASGQYAFGHGRDVTVSGNYAAGFGQFNTAGYNHQFVIGKYNSNKSGDIFEVGIGTSTSARANGLELDTSGNLKVAGTVTDSSGAPLAPSSAIAPVESGATASQAYASGEHFMRNGKFCTATAAIAIGDTLTAGTNYSEGNVAGSLGGGGGSSTLAGLTDTNISSPTDKQPLTYDATTGKWINGGVIPIANGGTGNTAGYIRTGKKANTTVGTGATIEGTGNTASQDYAHAEGQGCQATNKWAHAEGNGTVASGVCSHAEGSSVQATGGNSHAEGGGGVLASGVSSHAEGASTTASGAYSHAEGQGAKAQGQSSHAQNFYTTASGNYSSAAGYYTTAGYQNQFAIGKYNDNKSTNIFEVGIGTNNANKANALELDSSGNLKTAGTITDGQGHVLGQAVVADGVWVISGETATLTVSTP